VKSAVLAAALTIVAIPTGGRSQTTAVNPRPSVLEGFLERTKNPSIVRESLGTLTSAGAATAMFEAIIAYDPSLPAAKVKGLRVLLSEGSRKDTVYIDDDRDEGLQLDSLREFQADLARLVSDREKLSKEISARPGGVGALVCNRDSPEQYTPRTSVFGAYWTADGKQFGVGLMVYRVGWFHFPGADLARVVEFVSRGRAFLQQH